MRFKSHLLVSFNDIAYSAFMKQYYFPEEDCIVSKHVARIMNNIKQACAILGFTRGVNDQLSTNVSGTTFPSSRCHVIQDFDCSKNFSFSKHVKPVISHIYIYLSPVSSLSYQIHYDPNSVGCIPNFQLSSTLFLTNFPHQFVRMSNQTLKHFFPSCHRANWFSLLHYIVVPSPSSCIFGPAPHFASLLRLLCLQIYSSPSPLVSCIFHLLLSVDPFIHRLWLFLSPVFPCPLLSFCSLAPFLCLLYPIFLLVISWSTTSFSSVVYICSSNHYLIFSIELHIID